MYRGDMPKSAFSSNSQAQVAAKIIATELLNAAPSPVEYRNTCWSLIDTDDSVKVGGTYKPTEAKIQEASTFKSALEDTPQVRRANFEDSASWYSQITSGIFS